MIRRLLSLLGLVLLLPAAAQAQSLLSGFGLGLPGAPLDARSQALGSGGLGLSGWQILSSDLASSGGVDLPSISLTLQSSAVDLGGTVFSQTRFPQIGFSVPWGWNVISLELGSYLQQDWTAQSSGFLSIGGIGVSSTDTFTSAGGIGRLQLALSRRLIESFSFGVSAGRYVGNVDRTFRRVIDGTSIGQGVETYVSRGEWRASGLVIGAGFVFDPSPLLRVAGGVTWSDDLVLSPATNGSGEGRYSMPLEVRGGGTLTLTPGVSLVLGATFADWTATRDDLASAVSGEGASLSYGGGIEYTRLSLAGRSIPLRVGARHADLPFGPVGRDAASEQTISGGIGVHLVDGLEFPRATVDLGLEKGTRTGITSPESFWRLSLSFRVAGS